MEYKDYYKTLGVQKHASEEQVRAAYRTLARKHHPDVNPDDAGAEARFKEINEAYHVLSDVEKRAKYDRYGADWERYKQTAGARQQPDFRRWYTGRTGGTTTTTTAGQGDDAANVSDFFRTLFGTATARRTGAAAPPSSRTQRGADLEQDVEITLQEAFSGTERTLQLQGEQTCPECGGVGIRQSQLCDTCRGRGTVGGDRRIEVRIPAGAYEGARVRIAGKGDPGYGGGPAGDLYLRLHIRADERFTIDGADVKVDVPADLYACVLGGEVEVPTPSGRKLALTVPPGTQNRRSFRLRGQGMPRLGNPSRRGDLFALIEVRLPERLSAEERDLFERLREINGRDAAAAASA